MGASPDDVRRRLRALAVSAPPLEELWTRAGAVLRRAIPWDVAAWGTVDPATLLSTSCSVTGLPYDRDRELVVLALEHDEREPARLVELARRRPPAAGLHEETAGRPQDAPRYAAVLQPLGLTDDLRVAFVRDGLCWGSLYAYRRDGVFTAAEIALAGAVAEDLADAVRLTLLRGAAEHGTPHGAGHDDDQADPDGPAVLLVGEDGRLVASDRGAHRWLRLLGSVDGELPPVVSALLGALAADPPGPGNARLRTTDGRWAVVHASTLGGGSRALVVEPARPVVVADVLAAAYGFSPREREIVGLVLRGEGNRAVARRLGISEYTVKDHLKAVFAKAGVASRGELAATLLREQYLPRRDLLAPGPHGWFRDTA